MTCLIRRIAAAGAVVLLVAACGKAEIVNTTSYYIGLAGDDEYDFAADIIELEDGVINGSTRSRVTINGTAFDMAGNTFGPQSYTYKAAENESSFNVHFDADYKINYLLGPADRSTRDPDAGRFMIPIVGSPQNRRIGNARSDLDGDGIIDRYDNCPFHPNPAQEDTAPASGNRIGDACDAFPNATRRIFFQADGTPAAQGDYVVFGRNLEDGSIMLYNDAGQPVWALQELTSGQANVTGVSGVAALADIAPDALSVRLSHCILLYQDDDGGHDEPGESRRFVQIFGGPDCRLRLDQSGSAVVRGVDPLILIVTQNSPGASSHGKAWGYGRVTLQPIEGHKPLFDELSGGALPAYLYFVVNDFDPIGELYASNDFATYHPGETFDLGIEAHRFFAVGRIEAAGAFVVHP